MRFGDFRVTSTEAEKATEEYSERSETARRVDKRRRAPVTTSYREWKTDPSGLDFPGVDTPEEAPKVLPKDLKRQGSRPSLTGRASNSTPLDLMVDSVGDQTNQQQLASAGVPASTEEVYGNAGVDMGAFGERGRSPTRKSSTEPLDATPPDIARGESPDPYEGQAMPFGGERRDDRQFVFEEEDVGDQMTFGEFSAGVDKVKDQMGGAADDFAASRIVSEESADGGVDIFGDADEAVEKMEEESGGWF